MLATGWDLATLRRQPATVVRAVTWRLAVERTWAAARVLREAAEAPIPSASEFTDPRDWATARLRVTEVHQRMRDLRDALWPEDDDV